MQYQASEDKVHDSGSITLFRIAENPPSEKFSQIGDEPGMLERAELKLGPHVR
jgi:hypothetical protein